MRFQWTYLRLDKYGQFLWIVNLQRTLTTALANSGVRILIENLKKIQVESASLPVATFAKFQPQSVDFLDMTNPKAVLESRLRNFACLSTGTVFLKIVCGVGSVML